MWLWWWSAIQAVWPESEVLRQQGANRTDVVVAVKLVNAIQPGREYKEFLLVVLVEGGRGRGERNQVNRGMTLRRELGVRLYTAPPLLIREQ